MSTHLNPETTKYMNKYFYMGEDDLSKDIDHIFSNMNSENILRKEKQFNIVCFKINNSLHESFLQFLLDDRENLLNFKLEYNFFDKIKETNDYKQINVEKEFENKITNVIQEKIKLNKNHYDYKGFFNYQNEYYIFIHLLDEVDNSDTYKLVLTDEICYHENKFDKKLKDLLKNNEKFIYLKNNDNNIIEPPILVYNCDITKSDNNVLNEEFTNLKDFREPTLNNTIYGDRYIFKNPLNITNEYTKYALFIGKALYIFNNENIILDNNENIDSYENNNIIFVTDKNDNSYYLVNNINSFVSI